MHAPVLAVDIPEIDENEDSEVVQFTDQHITHALTDQTNYLEISNLVNKLQTQNHAKKKNVVYRFNAPWEP